MNKDKEDLIKVLKEEVLEKEDYPFKDYAAKLISDLEKVLNWDGSYTEILLNSEWGGYGLEDEFIDHLKRLNIIPSDDDFFDYSLLENRINPAIIAEFKKPKWRNLYRHQDIRIESFPSFAEVSVDDYDGMESLICPVKSSIVLEPVR